MDMEVEGSIEPFRRTKSRSNKEADGIWPLHGLPSERCEAGCTKCSLSVSWSIHAVSPSQIPRPSLWSPKQRVEPCGWLPSLLMLHLLLGLVQLLKKKLKKVIEELALICHKTRSISLGVASTEFIF